MRRAWDLLLVVGLLFNARAQGPITCQGGRFYLQQAANLTCYFEQDLNATRKNFNIVHYPLNATGFDTGSATYIILCNWKQQNAPEVDCKKEDWIQFNFRVSDKVSIRIPEVSRQNVGLYACQIVPEEHSGTQPCTLTVHKGTAPTTQPAVTTTAPIPTGAVGPVSGTVVCPACLKCNSCCVSRTDLAVALTLILTLFFASLIAFLLYVLFIRRYYEFSKRETPRPPIWESRDCIRHWLGSESDNQPRMNEIVLGSENTVPKSDSTVTAATPLMSSRSIEESADVDVCLRSSVKPSARTDPHQPSSDNRSEASGDMETPPQSPAIIRGPLIIEPINPQDVLFQDPAPTPEPALAFTQEISYADSEQPSELSLKYAQDVPKERGDSETAELPKDERWRTDAQFDME